MSAPEALHFEDGTPIYCEWTPRGPDKSLIWACMQPATYDDSKHDAWYCDAHKPTPLARVKRALFGSKT